MGKISFDKHLQQDEPLYSYAWSSLVWVFILGLVFSEVDCSNPATADEGIPTVRELLRDDPALLLAQALVAEAEPGRLGDHRAIIGVFRNRLTLPAHRGKSYPEMAAAYCSVFRSSRLTPRQVRIRMTPWDRIPAHVQELVTAVMAGEDIVDPCEGRAWDFGSREDALRKVLQAPLNCGRTENVFLGAPQRQKAPVMREEWIRSGTIPANVARGRR